MTTKSLSKPWLLLAILSIAGIGLTATSVISQDYFDDSGYGEYGYDAFDYGNDFGYAEGPYGIDYDYNNDWYYTDEWYEDDGLSDFDNWYEDEYDYDEWWY